MTLEVAAPGVGFEAEYNVRLLHPDRAAFHERGKALSRETYEGLQCRRDLRYGPGPSAELDFFPPAVPGSTPLRPLVAFFHGGYWQAHERSEYAFVAKAFAGHGIATAIVGYDLAPRMRMAQIVAQARQACTWLAAHAADLEFDAPALFAAGHSAGAHLAACAFTAPHAPVAGALLVSGIFDLEPLVTTTLNRALGLTRATAARWSPMHHAMPGG